MRSLLKLQAQGVVGERIIVAAGTQVPGPGGDNSTNRAWLFDPRTSAYEELPNAPKVVAKTVGVTVGEDLYVIGGMDFKPGVIRQVWRLSRRSGRWTWEEMPPMPFPRIFSGVAVVGTTIIVLGGTCVYDAANPAALSYPADLAVDTGSVIAFDTSRPHWLLDALAGNETSHFTPRAPVRLYYGSADVDVIPREALATAAAMKARGADIEAIDVGPLGHDPSALAAAPRALAWLESLPA